MHSFLNKLTIKSTFIASFSIVLLFAAISVHSSPAAVIGSFSQLANAQSAQSDVAKKLSVEPSIVETVINSRTWYRVVVYHTDARELVSNLKQQGYKDAWYLKDSDTSIINATQVKSKAAPSSSFAKLRASPLASAKTKSTAAAVASTFNSTDSNGMTVASKPRKVYLPRKPSDGDSPQLLMETIDGMPVHQIPVNNAVHSEVSIKIDGVVDEAIWQSIPAYDNMRVSVPGTGEPGNYPTKIRLIATERGLYVSSVMLQPADTLVSRMSTRDDFIDRDTFGITIDASGEGLMAYWFIVALGDSIMDGKVLPERNYQRDWDGPWIGKSARRADGWSVEMYLPWSMMNMPEVEGLRDIGFAATRQVSHQNERYQWPGHAYSSSRFVSALNKLKVDGVQPIQQLSIIPYMSSTIDNAREDDDNRVGFDLSWKPSPMLELSLSGFPDFGSVEADDVVLNLSAFETYFPEKRLFFLEGNEIFQTAPRSSPGPIMQALSNDNFATTSRKVYITEFAPSPISLMNSRRIGGVATQVDVPDGISANRGETGLPTDLLGAAKVTGSIGDFRYGVLAAVEDDVEWMATNDLNEDVMIDADGREFSIARFMYEDIGKDRRSIGYMGTFVSGPQYDALVHGIDMHYTNSLGNLIVDGQLIASDVDDVTGEGAMLDISYSSSRLIKHRLEFDYFDETVEINDLGFLNRNDYGSVQYSLLYAKPQVNSTFSDVRGTVILRQSYNISKGQITDSGIFWRNSMVLPGRNTIKTAIAYLPERFEDIDSRGNGAYRTKERWWLDAMILTDASKKLSYSFSAGGLQENLGEWSYNLKAGVTYRPTDQISVDFDLTYKDRHDWILYQENREFGAFDTTNWQPGVKINWFMAPSHQLRLTLQWVGVQATESNYYTVPVSDGELQSTGPSLTDHDFTVSIMTAQLRYRWELAPLTDLYLVYNRGNTLPNQVDSEFSDLFHDSLLDPVVDSFVAKFRYRFSN